ncbi:unnamed protein product [Somion occarium]|uniref:Uncharacterized protein n=1 Tax=Somion occarium TaxID=3059160 RepID=A0ABP1D4Y8_9APHY
MAFKKFRLGHPAVSQHRKSRRDATCTTGGFYKSPTGGQTVQAGQPLNISWDTSCMSTDGIDIYLYNPSAANPRIHLWENVNFALGSYETSLKASWWNATSSASLQFTMIPHGTPLFMATLPAGPLFTATYSQNSDVSGAASDDAAVGAVEQVNNFEKDNSLSKGKIAAAVLIPLLVVIALIVGAYIKINRKKGKEHRKQWSEAIDKRMSTISADWKSISPAGAQAAIRNSMAVSADANNRASSFSFGAIRPISTVAVEGGQAGIGAGGMYAQSGIDTTTPQMSQLRPGLRNPTNGGERVSRISFAADTRPSAESRRSIYNRNSRASRAFHTGHVPPLPARQDSNDLLSPTQTAGPFSLTADDINARMSGLEPAPRPSVDEMMPALSMMRTGGQGTSGNDDLLFQPKSPLPSPPAPVVAKSSVVGMMPMQPMPANMMSPDDMLRAYAERRNVASPPPMNGPTVPAPAAQYNGNGMRVLYSPTTPDSSAGLMSEAERKSAAPTVASRYDDDDAYVGTAA